MYHRCWPPMEPLYPPNFWQKLKDNTPLSDHLSSLGFQAYISPLFNVSTMVCISPGIALVVRWAFLWSKCVWKLRCTEMHTVNPWDISQIKYHTYLVQNCWKTSSLSGQQGGIWCCPSSHSTLLPLVSSW